MRVCGKCGDFLTELPSVNPQPCDDAISREDAIEALNTINGTAELDKAFEVIENFTFRHA